MIIYYILQYYTLLYIDWWNFKSTVYTEIFFWIASTKVIYV